MCINNRDGKRGSNNLPGDTEILYFELWVCAAADQPRSCYADTIVYLGHLEQENASVDVIIASIIIHAATSTPIWRANDHHHVSKATETRSERKFTPDDLDVPLKRDEEYMLVAGTGVVGGLAFNPILKLLLNNWIARGNLVGDANTAEDIVQLIGNNTAFKLLDGHETQTNHTQALLHLILLYGLVADQNFDWKSMCMTT
ncbi:hypothetical protein BP00DRAFT_420981 [Aspergillus indologenus CBS 114.80]|uniref:Uncharacterized protein n=1 Tax=Aspergillus indologenus CBS 114.80 TaxID=1450541 RepID=A0A2V5I8R1_9EURO|nr:hypothetical protein BP00DRAFT_420981 [Aspergillus indologenus CBS 114.80]